jgi:hypothetical protein
MSVGVGGDPEDADLQRRTVEMEFSLGAIAANV